MDLLLFHYTLIIMIVVIIAAATCLSAYLVSHKRLMALLFFAFLFYFIDMALVFQDEYIAHMTGSAVDPVYIFFRSVCSVFTGAGFLTMFWLAVCDHVGETRWTFLAIPTVAFAVLSMGVLCAMPTNEVQRFWFWTIHQLYWLWMLGYAFVRFLRAKDPVDKERLWRHRWLWVFVLVMTACIVAEDALCFLVLDVDTVSIGPFWFTAERNFAENVLALGIAIGAFRYASRVLSLRFERPPAPGGSKRQEQQITENLNVYAKRHGLSNREREVLYLVLIGKDNQNIASEMQLALSTVKVHVHNILKKTGRADRQDLVRDFWKTT